MSAVVPINKKITPIYDASRKPNHYNNLKPKVKPYFEPKELEKLGYKVDQISESKFRINGFIEIDMKNLKYTDFFTHTSGYLFTVPELNKLNPPNINSVVRKLTKSH